MTTRRDRFDDLVLAAAERARPWLGSRHGDISFAVEEVPPDDPAAWEVRATSLGRTVVPSRHALAASPRSPP